VVAPASVRYHWQEQVLNWLSDKVSPSNVIIFEAAAQPTASGGRSKGATQSNPLTGGGNKNKIIIISYNSAANFANLMKKSKEQFGLVIVDESHYIKNSKASRTKAVVSLIKQSKRSFLLSGTPALSRPLELFSQLNALDENNWPDEKAFARRSAYCVRYFLLIMHTSISHLIYLIRS